MATPIWQEFVWKVVRADDTNNWADRFHDLHSMCHRTTVYYHKFQQKSHNVPFHPVTFLSSLFEVENILHYSYMGNKFVSYGDCGTVLLLSDEFLVLVMHLLLQLLVFLLQLCSCFFLQLELVFKFPNDPWPHRRLLGKIYRFHFLPLQLHLQLLQLHPGFPQLLFGALFLPPFFFSFLFQPHLQSHWKLSDLDLKLDPKYFELISSKHFSFFCMVSTIGGERGVSKGRDFTRRSGKASEEVSSTLLSSKTLLLRRRRE